jgi:D-arginine dehydrogenase
MKVDVLIVGAGFAGASTAFHLSRSFSGSILVIDQESVPGFHASGRNAAMVRQHEVREDIRRAAAASRRAYDRYESELGFRQVGSLLLASADRLEAMREPARIESYLLSPREARRKVPLLDRHDFSAALWTPADGIMDISALLQLYLTGSRERGVTFLFDCRLRGCRGTGPFRLDTTQGEITAHRLVNAAGALAPRVCRLAGASWVPMRPLKRHLFVLGRVPGVNPHWPIVWNLADNFYFRPESDGLLISVCDEGETESLEPTVDADMTEELAQLCWSKLPHLRDAVQERVWSCFRTKATDTSFVIGWDPTLENFFWVAALGGHGMGVSWEVGRRAARKFLDRAHSDSFDPDRFQVALRR